MRTTCPEVGRVEGSNECKDSSFHTGNQHCPILSFFIRSFHFSPLFLAFVDTHVCTLACYVRMIFHQPTLQPDTFVLADRSEWQRVSICDKESGERTSHNSLFLGYLKNGEARYLQSLNKLSSIVFPTTQIWYMITSFPFHICVRSALFEFLCVCMRVCWICI